MKLLRYLVKRILVGFKGHSNILELWKNILQNLI